MGRNSSFTSDNILNRSRDWKTWGRKEFTIEEDETADSPTPINNLQAALAKITKLKNENSKMLQQRTTLIEDKTKMEKDLKEQIDKLNRENLVLEQKRGLLIDRVGELREKLKESKKVTGDIAQNYMETKEVVQDKISQARDLIGEFYEQWELEMNSRHLAMKVVEHFTPSARLWWIPGTSHHAIGGKPVVVTYLDDGSPYYEYYGRFDADDYDSQPTLAAYEAGRYHLDNLIRDSMPQKWLNFMNDTEEWDPRAAQQKRQIKRRASKNDSDASPEHSTSSGDSDNDNGAGGAASASGGGGGGDLADFEEQFDGNNDDDDDNGGNGGGNDAEVTSEEDEGEGGSEVDSTMADAGDDEFVDDWEQWAARDNEAFDQEELGQENLDPIWGQVAEEMEELKNYDPLAVEAW